MGADLRDGTAALEAGAIPRERHGALFAERPFEDRCSLEGGLDLRSRELDPAAPLLASEHLRLEHRQERRPGRLVRRQAPDLLELAQRARQFERVRILAADVVAQPA